MLDELDAQLTAAENRLSLAEEGSEADLDPLPEWQPPSGLEAPTPQEVERARTTLARYAQLEQRFTNVADNIRQELGKLTQSSARTPSHNPFSEAAVPQYFDSKA